MQKGLIKALNQLNQDFYAQISKDFSASRNFSWQGWTEIIKYLPKKENLKVLDIACGNGRFVEFLNHNLHGSFSYLGLDNSNELLKIAQNKFKEQQFEFFDLIKNYLANEKIIFNTQEKFDLIVSFGLSHHLPSTELREKFLQSLKNKLNKNGLIVVSNWQFAEEQNRFQKNTLNWKKIIKNPKINLWQKIKLIFLLLNLEDNDFLLDWRKGEKANQVFRYCHHINEKEMLKLIEKSGLKVVAQLSADGKSQQLNQYFLLTAL
ncbi:class I SAM-dependent methyltransferase [Patescibacteria group bacterium]|nr:class I SAM-dependent methyltransferase [Patescibacteria group bacterium]